MGIVGLPIHSQKWTYLMYRYLCPPQHVEACAYSCSRPLKFQLPRRDEMRTNAAASTVVLLYVLGISRCETPQELGRGRYLKSLNTQFLYTGLFPILKNWMNADNCIW